MKKDTQVQTVKWLESEFVRINFPEYQREPNVWSRDAKQRLIDSMLREFDIASLYFYRDEEGLDCIDGRQRIGAIMSFLGKNQKDADNGFELKFMNEIYNDEPDRRFHQFHNTAFSTISELAKTDPIARELIDQIRSYKLTVVLLSESIAPEEFNLQFTRLNLGTIINSGEKLHAMVGEFRDACFKEDGIGAHRFLAAGTKIPTRRYAKEQTAAQILAQVFSLHKTDGFTRTRHFDLQRFAKEHSELNDQQRGWIEEVRKVMELLGTAFGTETVLKNRAITVSVVLLALRAGVRNETQAAQLASFLKTFLARLKWQVNKYRDEQTSDEEYRYLLDFQRHLTQASVEKPAVEARARTLEGEFDRWRREGKLKGDREYEDRTGNQPG